MIICQNTKSGFLDDVECKLLQGKLEHGFQLRTGSIPSDRRVWEAEYADFAWDLKAAAIDADVPCRRVHAARPAASASICCWA